MVRPKRHQIRSPAETSESTETWFGLNAIDHEGKVLLSNNKPTETRENKDMVMLFKMQFDFNKYCFSRNTAGACFYSQYITQPDFYS